MYTYALYYQALRGLRETCILFRLLTALPLFTLYIALIISYISNDNEVDENHYQLSH